MSITEVGGSEVFSHTTAVMGSGDKELVTFNFTGEPDTDYILKFSDNGSNGHHGGIDDLKFGEIPADTVNQVAIRVKCQSCYSNNRIFKTKDKYQNLQ